MRNKVAIVAFAVLGAACAQIKQKPAGSPFGVSEPLALSPQTAYEQWKAAPDKVVILDVRTPEEYRSGHIRGAQNIDFYSGFEEAIQKLPKDRVYYLHCASGRRSASATEIMRKYGFSAYNIGGYSAVAQAGFPTE